jgi:Tol biopolymer transport system component
LKKIATAGGSATTIADAPAPAGGSWSADGRIVFGGSAAGGLAVVSDQGGEVRTLTTPRVDRGEVRHGWPSWLPDGGGILFTIAGSTLPGASSQLAVLPLPSSSWRLLRAGVSRGIVTGHDYLLLATGADLQAQTFDQRTLGLLGAADGVLDGLDTAEGVPQFTVNDAGTLMAVKAPAEGRAFAWSDEPGRNLVALSRLRDLSISPDNRRAAGVSVDAAGSDIFVVDLDRGSATRMTYGGTNAMPVWTPDGRLLFASRSTGPFSIVTSAPQRGGTQTVLSSDGHLFPGSAASDGRIAVTRAQRDGRLAIGIAAHAGGEIAFFNDGPFDQTTPAFSPDGMWLAFASNESGRWEIYVRNLHDGRRVAVSTEGGERPSWTADGRWIYFHDATRVLRAAFNANADPRAGAPEVVFNRPDGRVIAVAPSGRLLLEQQPAASQNAVIVLQWLREIRQRLPAPIPASR